MCVTKCTILTILSVRFYGIKCMPLCNHHHPSQTSFIFPNRNYVLTEHKSRLSSVPSRPTLFSDCVGDYPRSLTGVESYIICPLNLASFTQNNGFKAHWCCSTRISFVRLMSLLCVYFVYSLVCGWAPIKLSPLERWGNSAVNTSIHMPLWKEVPKAKFMGFILSFLSIHIISVLFYILNREGFQFLHIFTNTYYFIFLKY